MDAIVPPTERECERCGRRDEWDSETERWTVVTDDDGERLTGNAHCLHEWDINGAYNPISDRD